MRGPSECHCMTQILAAAKSSVPQRRSQVNRRLTTAEDAPAARACQAGGLAPSMALRSVRSELAIRLLRSGGSGRALAAGGELQVHALSHCGLLRDAPQIYTATKAQWQCCMAVWCRSQEMHSQASSEAHLLLFSPSAAAITRR